MAENILNTIKYSILDLATVCQGETVHKTFERSLQAAQRAEELEYTRYWFSEHHNMESVASAATAVLIGYVSGSTKTIRVGSGGIMLPNHSPLIIAEQFGTLGTLYPNRIDLGLGRAPGTDALTAMTIRKAPLDVQYNFKAEIETLQQYFNPANSTAKVRALPGEGVDVPIWILGSSTDSAFLAAEMGLPYAFAAHFAPAQLMQAMHIYHTQFKPSNVLQQPYAMACVNIIAADSSKEASELSTSLIRRFLGLIQNDRSPLEPPISYNELEELWTPEQKQAVLSMLAVSFIGTKESIKEGLLDFVEKTGVKEIMVTSQIFDAEKKLHNYSLIQQAFTS